MPRIEFTTISEVRSYIADAIEAGSASSSDYDLDAIADDAFERTPTGWAIEDPDDGSFWEAVERHDISE